jgi:hypothetical protein
MISKEIRKKIIEELARDGNILNACRKIGIAPATFYRWRNGDPGFKKRVDHVVEIGRMNMSNIAEHALMLKVKEKDMGAIKYLLAHNDPRYKPKTRKVLIEHSNSARDVVRQEMRDKWLKESEDRKKIADLLQEVLNQDDEIDN